MGMNTNDDAEPRTTAANQGTKRFTRKDLVGRDLGTFDITRRLIGDKSQAIDMLLKTKVKGRGDAKRVLTSAHWTTEQARICAEIERARKDVENAMEERRMALETSRTRQKQSADKYRMIRETIESEKVGGTWEELANQVPTNDEMACIAIVGFCDFAVVVSGGGHGQ
jgi:hypothetical protein